MKLIVGKWSPEIAFRDHDYVLFRNGQPADLGPHDGESGDYFITVNNKRLEYFLSRPFSSSSKYVLNLSKI